MPRSSRIPGFYKLAPDERLATLRRVTGLSEADAGRLDAPSLSVEDADLIIENVVGTFALPLGVGINLLVNGRDVVVPMVIEEPSVVAALSNMARVVRAAGGFRAEADASLMTGQVQVVGVPDPEAALVAIRENAGRLRELGGEAHPRLVERGGGMREVAARTLVYDEPGEPRDEMLVVEFTVDCVDAMGANMVNTMAEAIAPEVEALTGGRVVVRVLSNLADRRLARASCVLPAAAFDCHGVDGRQVIARIAAAWRFAWADPWRAATHNKGIMNGVDAVVLATGNDWRAIEAGAHAWAARDGRYRPLSRWKVGEEGQLYGSIELPVQVGTVGGSLRTHPGVCANLKMMGSPRARDLAAVLAAVGLAQNLGALRALACEGIQDGHMRLHARTVAVQAGAVHGEVAEVVRHLCRAQDWSVEEARVCLDRLRG